MTIIHQNLSLNKIDFLKKKKKYKKLKVIKLKIIR